MASDFRDASKAMTPAQKAHIVSGICRSHRGQEQHFVAKDTSQQAAAEVFSCSSNSSISVPKISKGSQAIASTLSQHSTPIANGNVPRSSVLTPGHEWRIGKPCAPPWASDRQLLLSAAASKYRDPGTALLLHSAVETDGLENLGLGGEVKSQCAVHDSTALQAASEQRHVDRNTKEVETRSLSMRRYTYHELVCLSSLSYAPVALKCNRSALQKF